MEKEATSKTAMTERIRMMTFIDDLGVGGTQRWLLHLLEGLGRRGYDHRVVVVRHIANRRFMEEAGQHAAIDVAGEFPLRCGYGLVRLWISMRAWKPDIAQTVLPTSDMIGRVLGRLAGVPVIVSSVRGQNVDKPGWQRWLDRRTAFIADRVVVNAEDVMRSAIRKEGVRKEQIVYIPNGVGSMAPGKSRESMRASLGIPANAKVIGAVGRLHASKGHDVLVAAFARLAAEMPDAYLAIAGDGGLRGRLEQQIADLRLAGRAHLLGVRDDIPDLLGAMDIFAHPSRWEGMPNALMEAMAAGLPVVASSVDGIKTLIRDNETGILVKSGAIGDLAAQLRRLILDDGFAMQLGRRAAQEMKEQFGLDRMCDAYDTLYRNLLRQKTVRIAGKGEP